MAIPQLLFEKENMSLLQYEYRECRMTVPDGKTDPDHVRNRGLPFLFMTYFLQELTTEQGL